MKYAISIVILLVLRVAWAAPLAVEVSAPSAILINAETGKILYQKVSDEKRFPGSITKIATAYYVLEKEGIALDRLCKASREVLIEVPSSVRLAAGSKHPSYRQSTDGSRIGIRVGEELSWLTLLYGMLLESGNDAANVLAESICGSVEQFMEQLNVFLREHQIGNTHFTNPHGLHDPAHWTTARDMAYLTRLALRNPTFAEIVKTISFPKPHSSQVFMQKNRLLRPGPYFYSKASGVKTGYTDKAGYTLVAAATHEGRTLIAVLLGCAENQDRFRDAIRLFETAFSEKKLSRTLFAKESDVFTHSMKGAKGVIRAALKEAVVLEYFPAEEPQFRAEIHWLPLQLPLKAGEMVGHLHCVDREGQVLVKTPLMATDAVSKHPWAVVVDFFFRYRPFLVAFLLLSCIGYVLKKQSKIVH